MDDTHGPFKSEPLRYVDAVGLANVLRGVPTKPVCDILLHSFLVGVRPIHPLLHIPTFREGYNHFWHWCTHVDISIYNQRLIDDPTFIPLLFSVLYCGAVAAPSGFWAHAPPLMDLHKQTVVDQLGNAYLKGLEQCQHTRHPTLNTLVASLLGRSCSIQDDDTFENLAFISTTVRIAQSLGLHREHTAARLDLVTREVRHRIWWHILGIDAQYSLRHGAQTCCGIEGSQWDVKMIGEASDEEISHYQPSFLPSIPTPKSFIPSPVVLFATGRYETTRFIHMLLNRVNSCHNLTRLDLNHFLNSFRTLYIKLKTFIDKVLTQEIPQSGLAPSRFVDASVSSQEALYAELSEETNVFWSWARHMLTMLKTDALITLHKAFLGHPELTPEQSEKLWNR